MGVFTQVACKSTDASCVNGPLALVYQQDWQTRQTSPHWSLWKETKGGSTQAAVVKFLKFSQKFWIAWDFDLNRPNDNLPVLQGSPNLAVLRSRTRGRIIALPNTGKAQQFRHNECCFRCNDSTNIVLQKLLYSDYTLRGAISLSTICVLNSRLFAPRA